MLLSRPKHHGTLTDFPNAEFLIRPLPPSCIIKPVELARKPFSLNITDHTAAHMSLLIELLKGQPVILCGDAADLIENLDDEIAPGYCWQENEVQAVERIRKLKALAQETGAELWPNHDLAFFEGLPKFPD